ncbi:hypothetical protein [Priestia endophytica]|uniref:Helix-turn-helix domain-containing protein n=1 Tax=Priestia endophytica DSM 13796 TaxID=1121089 RepID=A0A1I6BZW4_9BACI|nr:hypothetical protein [Priestia endophytica]KYG33472.1 hypothetical protein AZF06_21755 [Priestia endophytica]SFQ86482.1 hypothetical protein SAMN02745910_04650 [Priestia endophytica DSM 13796]
MQKIKNFLLSRTKSELKSSIKHFKGKELTKLVDSTLKVIEEEIYETEGVSLSEHLNSSTQYRCVRKLISWFAQEGFSQMKQTTMASNLEVSRPTLQKAINLLVELQIVHRLHHRRQGRNAPCVYVLVHHPNYLKVVEHFKMKQAYELEISPLYTERFTKDFTLDFTEQESEISCESKVEEPEKSPNRVNEVNLKKKDLIVYKESPNSDVVQEINKETEKNDQDIEFKEYYEQTEIYAENAGVPTELVARLKVLGTSELLKVWQSIKNTFKKYNLNPTQYLEVISMSITDAIKVYKYYQGKVSVSGKELNFNFAGCICGKIKQRVYNVLMEQKREEDRVLRVNNNATGMVAELTKFMTKNVIGLSDKEEMALGMLFREFRREPEVY